MESHTSHVILVLITGSVCSDEELYHMDSFYIAVDI